MIDTHGGKPLTPRAPETAISSKARNKNRIKLLKDAMPLLDNNLTQVVLEKLKDFDGWDSDSDEESAITQSIGGDNHLGYSHERSIVLQKKKVQMRVPKTLKGKSASVYREQCHRQRETTRKDMLEKAIRFVVASEKSQQQQHELLLISEISDKASSAAQGALRMATGRVKKWLKLVVDTIVKREVIKQAAKWQLHQERLAAKNFIVRVWTRYRVKCHIACIRTVGAVSLKEKREEEENETYAYRIRIAKRRAMEDEEVREFRARRHADMLRSEQLRDQQMKSNVGSPRTPGGSRVTTIAAGPRARRFKEKTPSNFSGVQDNDSSLSLSSVCSPIISRNSSSRQVLVKGSDVCDTVDEVNVDKWKDKTVSNRISVSQRRVVLPVGSIMESHTEVQAIKYENSLDMTSCTRPVYPSAFDSNFVSSFSKALTTKMTVNEVLRRDLKRDSHSIDRFGIASGIGTINEVASLCTDVGSRQGCSTIFGPQSYSSADDERIFQLSDVSHRRQDDPLALFKQNIDSKIMDLVSGEFQYTDEYYYGDRVITNSQAKKKVEESIRLGTLLMDESKVLVKIDQMKKTVGKQRRTVKKPGSAGRKSTKKPGSSGRVSTINKPGSAGSKPSSAKPGSRCRKSNSANKKSRPSSMKRRREKEISAKDLFDQECEPGLDLKEDPPLSLAKKMLQEYA